MRNSGRFMPAALERFGPPAIRGSISKGDRSMETAERFHRKLIFILGLSLEDCLPLRQQLEETDYEARIWNNVEAMFRESEIAIPSLLLAGASASSLKNTELCRRIRRSPFLHGIPLIMVLNSADQEHCVSALEAGADDVITSPFSPRELIARMGAAIRRGQRPRRDDGNSIHSTVMVLGDLEIHGPGMRILVRGKELDTTSLEFRLVEHLARNRGRVFTRDELLDIVWGHSHFVGPRSVDACIRRIRRKIQSRGTNPDYLKTVRGVGYRLDNMARHTEFAAG
jgi:DNA-binding response OmpR family regulator